MHMRACVEYKYTRIYANLHVHITNKKETHYDANTKMFETPADIMDNKKRSATVTFFKSIFWNIMIHFPVEDTKPFCQI